jgi:hypothetical protein
MTNSSAMRDIHPDWLACKSLDEIADKLAANACAYAAQDAMRNDVMDCLLRAVQLSSLSLNQAGRAEGVYPSNEEVEEMVDVEKKRELARLLLESVLQAKSEYAAKVSQVDSVADQVMAKQAKEKYIAAENELLSLVGNLAFCLNAANALLALARAESSKAVPDAVPVLDGLRELLGYKASIPMECEPRVMAAIEFIEQVCRAASSKAALGEANFSQELWDARVAAASKAAPAEPWGPFRHSNGVICCGSLRVARADFDTNPPPEVQKEILDALCGVRAVPAEGQRVEEPYDWVNATTLHREPDTYNGEPVWVNIDGLVWLGELRWVSGEPEVRSLFITDYTTKDAPNYTVKRIAPPSSSCPASIAEGFVAVPIALIDEAVRFMADGIDDLSSVPDSLYRRLKKFASADSGREE